MNYDRSTRQCRQVPLDDQPPSVSIPLAIATVEGRDPTGLPPLYETLDTEMLDYVAETRDDVAVSFDYVGYTVTVEGSREIRLDPNA